MSQAQLASITSSIAGDESMLSQRLSGVLPIPLEVGLAYAEALDVSVADFSPRLAAQLQATVKAAKGEQRLRRHMHASILTSNGGEPGATSMENSTTAFKCYHILAINGSKVEKHYYLLADTPEDALKYARSEYKRSALFFHCAEVDYQEMRSALVHGEVVFSASHTINSALEKEVERLRNELNAAYAAQHSTRNCA